MKHAYVSIDLGTTRLKAAAFEPSGKLLHQVARRHKTTAAGQDANLWWHDAVAAVRELVAAIDEHAIAGLSLSGRGGAGVFADANGKVLAQPWSDGRHRTQQDFLNRWRKDRFLSNYGASLIAKYQWLVDNEPATASSVRYAFYAKDWLLYKLTGAHKTDWSSGPDRATWGDDVVDDLALPENLLPEPCLPWDLGGYLAADPARELGLQTGIPVAVGAHDGICANVGAGATRAGEYAVTIGTHAVTRTVVERPPENSYRFYCLPETRHVIGGNAIMAGRSADWFLDLTGEAGSDRNRLYAEMETAAAAVAAGADGAVFLPFLSGRVAPELRLGASGIFAGLHGAHGKAELYRAVIEGAAFAIGDIFEQIVGWCGPPVRVRLTGGGAASTLWTRLIANVLGRRLEISDEAVEGRGAIIFLAVALGEHSNYDDAADTMVPVLKRVVPTADDVALYQSLHGRWRTISELTKPLDEVLESRK